MKLTRRHAVLGLFAATPLAVLHRNTARVSRAATAFGTTVRLTVTAETETRASAAIDAGYAEIRAIEKAFSLFDPASEVSRLNAEGHLDYPSAMMREVVALADVMWRKTGGAFDPTVQPLWLAWKNGLPPDDVIHVASSLVNWGDVAAGASRISFQKRGMALTFNGIAQGYAADRVMAAVTAKGASAATIDTGEWGTTDQATFAIRDPRDPSRHSAELTIASGFIATSGDYAATFTPDFENHHIFDPVTGQSPRDLSSVTVSAQTGAAADALATAFLVMGAARARQLLSESPHARATFIAKNGTIIYP